MQKDPGVLPHVSARRAGLRYVEDRSPGIRRVKHGSAFVFLGPNGKRVGAQATLKRIRALAIPPAWTQVWICPLDNGHLQATGRDARGRKQYRYHPSFRQVREATKYEKVLGFAQALPSIRARCAADLVRPGLSRNKVLATVVTLLDRTLIRVGNEEYARDNHSYGLTTFRDRHARIRGGKIEFKFRGKSGKYRRVLLSDRRLASIVKRCQDLPGEELFQYLDDDGKSHSVGSSDVNDYLREITGQDFTAKDFRTWAGTVHATIELSSRGVVETSTAAKRVVVEAVCATAERLGNTPAICRKCYVHPVVIETFMKGRGLPLLRPARVDSSQNRSTQGQRAATGKHAQGLRAEERAVLTFLRRATALVTEPRATARTPAAKAA